MPLLAQFSQQSNRSDKFFWILEIIAVKFQNHRTPIGQFSQLCKKARKVERTLSGRKTIPSRCVIANVYMGQHGPHCAAHLKDILPAADRLLKVKHKVHLIPQQLPHPADICWHLSRMKTLNAGFTPYLTNIWTPCRASLR